jgi:N-acetylneuraminate synthase
MQQKKQSKNFIMNTRKGEEMAKIIAEIGINHNGQLEIAKEMISMAKKAGADYVKFQIRDVDTVYAGQLHGPRNDGNPYGWKTVGEQKRGIELSLTDYEQIDDFCRTIKMPWFASCWDVNSYIANAMMYQWPYNKIASAMVTNLDFCREVAVGGRPVIISTGGCTHQEILDCVQIFRNKCPVTIMHCIAEYPAPDDIINLNMLLTLRKWFPWATIGYSGHEVGLYPSIMSLALGAKVIERHVTLDRSMYGSDQAASLEPKGLATLCDIAHNASKIFGDGKKRITEKEIECMKKLRYWEGKND